MRYKVNWLDKRYIINDMVWHPTRRHLQIKRIAFNFALNNLTIDYVLLWYLSIIVHKVTVKKKNI